MKLCISIQPGSMKEALKSLKRYTKLGEVVEIRIDNLKNLNLSRLLSLPRPEIILTYPWKSNTDKFNRNFEKYYTLLHKAAKNGVEYIDVEMSLCKKIIKRFRLEKINIPGLICSYHDYQKTPNNLHSIYDKMKRLNPDIIKIATKANRISDNRIMFDILNEAKNDKRKVIGICMGEYGEISRIIGGKFGSYLGYTCPEEKRKTAPGQFSYDQMKYLFRTDRITMETKIFGLIGNPVKYSKGIYFHNKIFSQNKVDAVYINILVDNLSEFFSSIMEYITGISVTMPFKSDVVKYIDRIENGAKELKIINTVLRKKGNLIGYNSDLYAITNILKKIRVKKDTRIIILGTGNMSRTILFACNIFGAKPVVVSRYIKKSRELTKHFDCDFTDYKNINGENCDLLINTTPVGMGTKHTMPPISTSIFNKKPYVIDVIANPSYTKFIATAEKFNCKTITGDEIFTLQARYQSSLFLELCK